MSLEESKMKADKTVSVEKDKFDRHMEKARRQDIESKETIFVHQSEREEERGERRNGIKPSVY